MAGIVCDYLKKIDFDDFLDVVFLRVHAELLGQFIANVWPHDQQPLSSPIQDIRVVSLAKFHRKRLKNNDNY